MASCKKLNFKVSQDLLLIVALSAVSVGGSLQLSFPDLVASGDNALDVATAYSVLAAAGAS